MIREMKKINFHPDIKNQNQRSDITFSAKIQERHDCIFQKCHHKIMSIKT